jgi:hypothetical protein
MILAIQPVSALSAVGHISNDWSAQVQDDNTHANIAKW